MRDLSSVDLNLLVSLDLLLDERSVRGAARRAHVSPSAMSHTLGRLRELLGDEVLVRAGRGMVPTPRAEELAVPTKELLARAREVLSDPLRFDPARLQRRFRIACTDHVSTVLLQPAEARLAAEAVGVDFLVLPVVPETMEELRRGTIDVAIGVFPDAPPEVRMRRLFVDRFVTVCRRDHPRVGERLTRGDFLREAHALVAPRGTAEGHVDRLLAAEGEARRVARAFPGFLAALWSVVHSDALLTVSARLVAATRSKLPVAVHPPPVALSEYGLMLAWHPRVDKAVEDAWFRSLLVGVGEGLGPAPTAAELG